MGHAVQRFVVSASLALVLAACASARNSDRPRHEARLITAEDIARTGAVDGLEALKRAGSYVNIGERRGGDIRASSRGRSSFILSPQMLLVVDEVVMNDINSLRDIRANTIDWMRIMTGAEATPIYGTPAANGVLVVRTKIPLDK